MTAERRIAKNAVWLGVQPLIMNVLSLAATHYIANRLGVTDFGRFNLGLTFVAMFAPLTHLGLRGLTVRHLPQHRDTAAEYLGKVLVLRIILAAVVAVVVIVAAPLSGGSGNTSTVIAISAFGLMISTLSGVFSDAFQAFERVRPIGLANLLSGIVLTVASVVAVKVGGGIKYLALAYAIGPLCSLLLLWTWSYRLPFRPHLSWDPPAFRQLLQQASPFFGIIIVDVVSTRMDVLALVWLLGDAKLGYYSAAMSLIDRAMFLAAGAADALLPPVLALSADSPDAARPLLRKSALWLLMVSLPIAVITTAFAPMAIRVVFGSRYAAGSPLLAIGIWRLPAMCLATVAGYSLLAVKRQDIELSTGAMGSLLSLAFLFPLVSHFGFVGGALCLAIRPLLVFLLRLPHLIRQFPSLWPGSQLARVAAALGLMCVPLLAIPSLRSIWVSLALLPVSAAVYLASLVVMRVIPGGLVLQSLRQRRGRVSRSSILVPDPGPGKK